MGLGILAFSPLIAMLAMVVTIIVLGMPEASWTRAAWAGAMALTLISWVAIIWNAWNNMRVPSDKRALWTAVLVFAGPYAMPFYFWFYLR
jgi:hypothetical protein